MPPNNNTAFMQASKVNHSKSHTSGHALKLILVGEGGQGIQTIAKILSRSAFEAGYHASFIPNFGTEQRGGLSLAYIQFSKSEIISPKFRTADLFVITSNRDVTRSLQYVGPTTNVLYDVDLLEPESVRQLARISSNLVPIHAFYEAIHQFSERSFNVILLGILTGLIDVQIKDVVILNMTEKFEKYYQKNLSLKKENSDAFNLGLSMTSQS
jgi:2-oxoglutarate ferredoxin oxidoreductase subunit gamma